MKKIILSIVAAGIIAVGSGALYLVLKPEASIPPEPEVKLVAEVNGKPITAKVFNEKYSRFTLRFHIPVADSPDDASPG